MDETVIKLPSVTSEDKTIKALNNIIEDQWRALNIRIKRLERNMKIVAGGAALLCLIMGYVVVKKSHQPVPVVPDRSDNVRFQRELLLKLLDEHDPSTLNAKMKVLNAVWQLNQRQAASQASQ